MVFIAGISIALFLEFLLVSKKNKSFSDKILILWMFLIALHLFLFYLWHTGKTNNYPFLIGIEMPLPLFHGVLLYMYVASVTDQLPANRKILLLHFIPVTLMYLYLTSFFALPAEQKIQIYKNEGAGYEIFNAIRYYAIALSGIVYVIWSMVLLKTHRRNILNQFSDLEKINLQWLQIITWGMFCIWIIVIFVPIETFTFGGVVLFVLLTGFFGIRQVGIINSNIRSAPGEGQKAKYSKSGLSEESSKKLHQSLNQLMEKEGLYRKSNLSISELAAMLDVHPNYLSQIINSRDKKNFYDYINDYRVEEFKRLIAKPENRHLTLLAVAYECGFNSKSSFNRHFKKATGQTPSEYFVGINQN